jgi:hypothetical protein
MPLLGAGAGTVLLRWVRAWDHWVVFGVLGILGARMIYEAVRPGGVRRPHRLVRHRHRPGGRSGHGVRDARVGAALARVGQQGGDRSRHRPHLARGENPDRALARWLSPVGPPPACWTLCPKKLFGECRAGASGVVVRWAARLRRWRKGADCTERTGGILPHGQICRLVGISENTLRAYLRQYLNTRHVGHIGKCKRCGRRIVSELPGMSSVGDASTQVQLGPNVAAMALELRFDYHVPARGISRLLGGWFGPSVSAGGMCGLFAQLAQHTAPAYDEVLAHVRSSAVVGLDETGLRQDGVGAWVWIARTDTASLFRVELSRGAWMADEILGSGFMAWFALTSTGIRRACEARLHATRPPSVFAQPQVEA